MLRIHRLACEPPLFEPIDFHDGVNLILGERSDTLASEQGRKVNGVGKSICIEFLHFALCRSYFDTRVSRIPADVLPESTIILLDLTVGNERMQIRRSVGDHRHPTILKSDGSKMVFERVEDATDFLGGLLFESQSNAGQVSFRQLVSLLMRDERSGFKNYINPHDSASRSPDDMSPHLHLMGIEISPYKRLLGVIARLEEQKKLLSELKRVVTNGNELKLKDIPARLNEERQATRKIEDALTELKADPAFEEVEEDLVAIESELERLRARRKSLSYQIDQIRAIPLPERIDVTDLRIIYDRIKAGLGDLVEKSLEQAEAFKAEIERFQQSLRNEELAELELSRRLVSSSISELSDRHAELTRHIDRKGLLSELTNGLEVATRRSDDYHRLSSQYQQYLKKNREVENIKTERMNALHALDEQLASHADVEQSFNETIVSIHEKIQLSSRASFRFDLNTSASSRRPLNFDLRIQDDGSHSINQVRVFIYDMALLLDPMTRPNHPGFLVHDNILEVDQDTLARCLNFLAYVNDTESNFQYILTLNRDKIESDEFRKEVSLDIEAAKCASFTKKKQFLNTRYQELSKLRKTRRKGNGG